MPRKPTEPAPKPQPKPTIQQMPPTVLNEYTKLYNSGKAPKPRAIVAAVRG
jgi:hypothetical protein